MFRVAICDDEPVICSQIENIILNCQFIINKEMEIEVFYSGEELCAFIENGYVFDLIFLDIELKLINGIETCKKIRNEYKDEITQVVYISGKQGYAMNLFESRPLNFLVKPLNEEKIMKNVKKAIQLAEKGNSFFEFKVGKTQYRLKLNDIMYFESNNKKIKVITINENYEFYGKIPDIMKMLPEKSFIAVHKSYFVNFLFVKESQYEYLILINGKSLPISKPCRKHVMDTLVKRKKEL
jgi:DNA-binding LytR/AlgR family response regulator